MANNFSRPLRRCVTVLALALLAAAATAPTAVHAWWGKGHLTVSQVAMHSLKNPDNPAKLQAIMNAMATTGPYKDYNNCVDVAMWSDDLKSTGLYTQSSWHFVNYIYNPSNFEIFTKEGGDFIFHNSTLTEILAAKRNPVAAVNVGNLIPMLINSLTSQSLFLGDQAETAGQPFRKYSDIVVSSIANLIHFIGDLHQPLHSTALFSEELPTGDQGGNKIDVWFWDTEGHLPSGNPDDNVSMRLHYFWDSIAEGPQDDPARPLSESNAEMIEKFARYIEAAHPATDALRNEPDSQVWALESHEAAKKFVYNFGSGQSNLDTRGGMYLDAEYIRNAELCAQQRIALAGYRLAAVLDRVLEDITLSDITHGLDTIREKLAEEMNLQPRTVNNYYRKDKEVSAGAAAGVAIACFVLGAVIGTGLSVLACVCCCRRNNSRSKSVEPIADLDGTA